MSSSSKFDIIIYGATGFTGQLVAEYLAAQYRNDKQLKWAMAGRSLDKLKSVRDAIGAHVDTPLIVADGAPPQAGIETYTPSSVPGGRAPHLWLDDARGPGGSLFDRLGPYFTLLCFAEAETAALERAAQRAKVPLQVVKISHPAARELYPRNVDLAVDMHGRYDATTGKRVAKEVERFKLMWLEEPVPAENIDAMRDIRQSTSTPICFRLSA